MNETPLVAPPEHPACSELRELAKRAKAGDASVLPLIRKLLDRHPEVSESIGDLERIVVKAWVERLGADPLAREAIERKAKSLRTELSGSRPTAVEKLLIGNVVAAWLALAHAQLAASGPGGTTLPQGVFDLRRLESAQKRFLAVIKTLTTLRALVPQGFVPASDLNLKLFQPAERSTG